MNDYDIVIGLEVHCQLKTASKIFCGCSTAFENPANSNICPVCAGYPGVLPVFNAKALSLGVRTSLALNCKINEKIYFERKNYFYPDLPKNYQISQFKQPLGEKGFIELLSGRKIGITRVHLEEDAGKSIHKENYSLVDLNRTGTPLMEIVSEPDMVSPQEAYEYLTALKMLLRYIGVSDCDMEKGSLRCDANISLKKKGETKLGTKVELKNMNSFKGVRDGLNFEAFRQEKVLNSNEKIFQETRLWDDVGGKTVVMRTKEESHDYRYFPEPDLLDFSIPLSLIGQEKPKVGESPLKCRARFLSVYGLGEKDADTLVGEPAFAEFFEAACKYFNDPKKIAGWFLGPLLEQANTLTDKFDGIKITPENFAQVVKYFSEGKLNNLAAKKVLAFAAATNDSADKIIEREGLTQVSDESAIEALAKEAIAENVKVVEEYKGGKQQAIMFLVGQVMKKSKGKANPQMARGLLEEIINGGNK